MPNFYRDNDDILFHMKHMDLEKVIGLKEDHFADKGKYDYAPVNDADARDSYERILNIVGDLAGNFIDPRATDVDLEEAHFENGEVRYAKGTQESMDRLKQADLMGFTLPRKYGGLNCPITIYSIAIEMVTRADAAIMNLFGLQDIAETINKFADEEIKMQFLPRFCTGEVTGSMALTEPDAGSDLQAVNLKAYQDDKGQWRLKGVKRFITNGCGEISLVLARSEEGTSDGRGLSMFVYERDKHMVIRRIEHKLGIHGSPTCELQFNDAPAILVGKRKYGLIKYVMSLMNGARLAISAQGVGIAEAAYREANKYATERIQFKRSIREFMAVKELLAQMKMKTEAARTLLYETATIVDIKEGLEHMGEKYPEKEKELRDEVKYYTGLAAMMTPISKAYSTEIANQVAYDAIQVHGGTGFMREFKVERFARDARITNIYEGTTQLQVVAAIGGIVKGVFEEYIAKLEREMKFNDVEELHKRVKEMYQLTVSAIHHVKDKADEDYQEYHARRIVEMSTNTIIGYLMLRDAGYSERKKDMAQYFIEFAHPENKMKNEIIMNDTKTLLERSAAILNENIEQ
ncbi:MAG: acyl-CoA dehydrogenase [Spirochaetes bacterium GWF1_51_8]|nr:MAG: acyl-CoA dehydrogenase [Spirochaetes bacterium GWF1_51_8]